MVVCADKRSLVDGTPVDDVAKLRPLGALAGFTCVGATAHIPDSRFFPPLEPFPPFDCFDEVPAFVAQHQLNDFAASLPALANFLRDDFTLTIRGMEQLRIPLPPRDANNIHFRVLIFRMAASQKPEMGIVDLSYVPTPTGVKITASHTAVDDAEFQTARLFSFGSANYIQNELRSGRKKSFEQFRNLAFVQDFIVNRQPVNEVTKTRAAEVSREFIKFASEHSKEFTGFNDISADSDCLVVPYTGQIEPLP